VAPWLLPTTVHGGVSHEKLAGSVRRISGVPPLSIVVGNAQGVKMTYAGRAIDLARHTKIDVARLTLE